MFVRLQLFRKRHAGYTIVEAIAAFLLASGVIAAVTTYVLYSFRMSAKAKVDGDAVLNAQLAFNFIEKQMFDVENIYDKNSGRQVIFRQTYIPDDGSYDGTTSSLRSKWGSFWFRLTDDDGEELKVLHYLAADESDYHATTGLTWSKRFAFTNIDDVSFSYSDKRLVVTIWYTKNKESESRSMIFFYPQARSLVDTLTEDEEPEWDPSEG